MTGWCPYLPGRLDQAECHFDGYCEECPHHKRFEVIRLEQTKIAATPGGRQFADEYQSKLIKQDAFLDRNEDEEYITISAKYSFMLREDE